MFCFRVFEMFFGSTLGELGGKILCDVAKIVPKCGFEACKLS